jgi:hypothetical protein
MDARWSSGVRVQHTSTVPVLLRTYVSAAARTLRALGRLYGAMRFDAMPIRKGND